MRRLVLGGAVIAGAVCAGAAPARAHPLAFTAATLTLGADAAFRLDLICDLDALALGAPLSADDAALAAAIARLPPAELDAHLARLRRLFTRRVRVRFDGEPAPFDVAFPDHGAPLAGGGARPTVLGLTARLTGAVPAGAADVSVFASRAFGEVHLTVIDAARGVETRTVLEAGARSDPFDLTAPPPPPPARTAAAARYLRLGFVHIVPDGLDHILFVLGLFLLQARLRPLVWQVTAFTAAHAATLTLAALGLVSLPARVVEPLIAASIVWVAVENLATGRLTRWRAPVVFAFGLLHGLGFAGALDALALPAADRLLGLAAFNAGIEAGQLAVLAAAAATIGGFRRRPWYRRRLTAPLSAGIAAVGLMWAVERTLGW